MARVRVELRITGQLSNDDARRLAENIEAFEAHYQAAGLEVKSSGCDVQFDAEPEPVAEAAAPAEDDGA